MAGGRKRRGNVRELRIVALLFLVISGLAVHKSLVLWDEYKLGRSLAAENPFYRNLVLLARGLKNPDQLESLRGERYIVNEEDGRLVVPWPDPRGRFLTHPVFIGTTLGLVFDQDLATAPPRAAQPLRIAGRWTLRQAGPVLLVERHPQKILGALWLVLLLGFSSSLLTGLGTVVLEALKEARKEPGALRSLGFFLLVLPLFGVLALAPLAVLAYDAIRGVRIEVSKTELRVQVRENWFGFLESQTADMHPCLAAFPARTAEDAIAFIVVHEEGGAVESRLLFCAGDEVKALAAAAEIHRALFPLERAGASLTGPGTWGKLGYGAGEDPAAEGGRKSPA
ncbi:MAG: hypothetical protein AB1896_00110 [Thermodesulfobacteriota bacterium]